MKVILEELSKMAISRAMLFLQAQLQQVIYKNESLIEENEKLKGKLAKIKKLYNGLLNVIDKANRKVETMPIINNNNYKEPSIDE